MIYVPCDQGSPEWLAARAGVITASNFADAISMVGGLTEQQSKYVQAIQAGSTESEALAVAGYKAKPKAEVVERALAGLPVGEPSDASEKLAATIAIERISGQPYGNPNGKFFATERGHEQEAFARMRYEARNKLIVDEAGVVLTDDRLFGYSTDGLVGDEGLIEVKAPLDMLKVVHIIQTGDIAEYLDQIQGGLWITGRKWCDFLMAVPDLACLNNGNELYVKRVLRDDNRIEDLELKLLAFERRVSSYETLLRTPYGHSLAQAAEQPATVRAPKATSAPAPAPAREPAAAQVASAAIAKAAAQPVALPDLF